MALYRLFPTRDAFIFSEEPTANTGKDEILELAGYPDLEGTGQASRILIRFDEDDITSVIDNHIGSENFSASVGLYLAEAGEVPQEYSIYGYPVFTDLEIDWVNGVGKFGDLPVDRSGVSWGYMGNLLQHAWEIGLLPEGLMTELSEVLQIQSDDPEFDCADLIFDAIAGAEDGSYFVTGSYPGTTLAGGTWYTKFDGQNVESIQHHKLDSTHDIELDFTVAVREIYQGELDNRGFILKLADSVEFQTGSYTRLKYFGVDTNTIYPPYLEFRWDDSSYVTGSLSVLDTDVCIIDVNNNKGKYIDEGKQRFRLTARPKYPTRTFQTSSVYLNNYALPSRSYWGIKDENTEEMIFNYSEFTKISCDEKGPYFDVYMGGLQPERFYRLLIKTELDTSTVVIDSDNVFKVTRN